MSNVHVENNGAERFSPARIVAGGVVLMDQRAAMGDSRLHVRNPLSTLRSEDRSC